MSETTGLIRRLRDDHKLNQVQIAELTKIPQPRLSRWEGGEAPKSADDALKLRALLEELDRAAEPTGEAA